MSGSVLTSYDDVTALIGDINAEILTTASSRTSLLAVLNTAVTNLTILRDLKFPDASTDTGLLLVNAGGQLSGAWAADSNFVGGVAGGVSSSGVSRSTSTAPPVAVLQTFRQGMSAYVFTLAAGRVDVQLGFADTVSSAATQRVQDISINGDLYLHNLDCFAATGAPGRSVVRDVVLNHAGGALTIAFTASAGQTLINSIKVTDATGVTVTTPVAVGLPSIPTGSFRALYWANTNFSGPPVATGTMAYPIAQDWGSNPPAPGIPATNWSAQFDGYFTFTASDYASDIVVDDGIKMLVDSGVIPVAGLEAAFIQQPPTGYTASYTMTAGTHLVTLQYNNVAFTGSLHYSHRLVTTPVTPPPVTATGFVQGVVSGGVFPGDAASFSTLLGGHDVPVLMGYSDTGAWVGTFLSYMDNNGIGGWLAARSDRRLEFGMHPILNAPGQWDNPETANEAAALGHAIVANAAVHGYSPGQVYIKFAEEANGNYGYQYQPRNFGDDFAGFIRMYKAAHNAMNAAYPFKWVQCYNLPFVGTEATPFGIYPGDGNDDHGTPWVWMATLDTYDDFKYTGSVAGDWAAHQVDLDAFKAFCVAHGLHIGCSENALCASAQGNNGHDDNAYYVTHMHDWCKTNGLDYRIEFRINVAETGGVIDNYPLSIAAMRTAVAGD